MQNLNLTGTTRSMHISCRSIFPWNQTLEAFSNRVEMSKAVEGVVRFLWDKKQLLVDRVPYVLVADHSGRLDCYIQHMTDSEYGKHTGDCYRKL